MTLLLLFQPSSSNVTELSPSIDPTASSCQVDSSFAPSLPFVTEGDLDAPELISNINSSSSPPVPILVEPVTPVGDSISHTALPPAPAPTRTLAPRSSSREYRPTECGSLHSRLVEASVQHREKLHANREARQVEATSANVLSPSPIDVASVDTGLLDDDNPFVSMCCTGALDDRLPADFPASHLTVSLDVEDYLCRDNDGLWEATLLSGMTCRFPLQLMLRLWLARMLRSGKKL
ncbi:hypothetical protein CVT25_012757 [Psilocybe cyanescens]|uniref:Uncharacterized protein n=1 Tax=Psilocybe cyanescens TaxID=93625 RepID=A0A409X4E5_PSICY|nr:hypothetical protein CVT25_012757 [Psilocybe cyanescens]